MGVVRFLNQHIVVQGNLYKATGNIAYLESMSNLKPFLIVLTCVPHIVGQARCRSVTPYCNLTHEITCNV